MLLRIASLIMCLSCSYAFASTNEKITISDLLAQGYEIVAAATVHGLRASVYLQNGKSAFVCITGPEESDCYSLNEHK